MDESQDVQQEQVLDNSEVETEEKTTPPTDSTAESEQEEATPEPTEEKTFTQAELDAIVQKRLAKESRRMEKIARTEAENAYLRQQLEARQQPQPAENEVPRLEDYQTAEEYLDALADYKMEQKLAKFQELTKEQQQEQAEVERIGSVRDKLMAASDKYDDFQDVVDSIPDDYITVPMFEAIGESDLAGEISYYLGNNHAEAAKIAKMTPVQQVKAIDRLETQLKGTPKVSKAPEPLSTVGKGRAKTEPDLEKMSVAEYAAYRAKNGARWAR
jgi:hypothetical protein